MRKGGGRGQKIRKFCRHPKWKPPSLNVEDMPSLLGNGTLEQFLAFMDNSEMTLTDWRYFLGNTTLSGHIGD